MDITKEIPKYTNKCFICGIIRSYKTKQGYEKANKKKSPCNSCKNSIKNGGAGILYNDKNQKFCASCSTYLDLNKFYKDKKGKYHGYCLACKQKKSNEYHSAIHRFKKYNINKEEYTDLIKSQNNLCAICNAQLMNPQIDHDHKTGKIRGILCRTCNIAIGLFKDDQQFLINAINYLKK